MRRGAVIAALATLAFTSSAVAKNGDVGHILISPPVHAKAGTLVTVKWTVDGAGRGGKAVAFAAVGMFVRLVGRNGASRTAVAKEHQPPYSARIAIPAGGLAKIELGLEGWASTPAGAHYAPEFFPIR